MRTKVAKRLVAGLLLSLSIGTLLFHSGSMEAQGPTGSAPPKPWFVWEKISPCQDTRQDWFTVSQTYPGESVSTNSWQYAFGPMTFSTAMTTADTAKMGPFTAYKNRCCSDWAVFEDIRTKALSVIRLTAILNPPEGKIMVRSGLCCEEAFNTAFGTTVGSTRDCRNLQLSSGATVTLNASGTFVPTGGGGMGGANACFAGDPGVASTNRNDHYNWAQQQSGASLETNLRNKINLLFNCSSVTADQLLSAFADYSVVIARYVQNSACFAGDAGAINTDWAAHIEWARSKSRSQLLNNLQWKMSAAFKCLNHTGQSSLFADSSIATAKAPLNKPEVEEIPEAVVRSSQPTEKPKVEEIPEVAVNPRTEERRADPNPTPQQPSTQRQPVGEHWILDSVTVNPEQPTKTGQSKWSYSAQSSSAHLDLYNGDQADFQWTPPPQQIDSNGFTVSFSVQTKPAATNPMSMVMGVWVVGLSTNSRGDDLGAHAQAETGGKTANQAVTFKPISGSSKIEVHISLAWSSVTFNYIYRRAE